MTTESRGTPSEGEREVPAKSIEFAQRIAGHLPPPPTGADGKQLSPKQAARLTFLTAPDAIDQAQRDIRDRMGKPGMLFGWDLVDQALVTPIVSKELLTVAARTGVGKSWALQQFAETQLMADSELVALYISLEMSVQQVAERVLLHVFDGATPQQTRRALEQDDQIAQKAREFAPHLDRFYIADVPLLLEEIPDAVHMTEQRCGMKVKLLLVDYLGLLGSSATRGQRLYERVSELARQLKGIALELDLVVVLAVQLSRGGGGAGDVEPDIAALRDSGAIEEASDRILLMWQTGDEEESIPGDYIKVKLAKNRHGERTGPVLLRYNHSRRLQDEISGYRLVGQDDIPF